MSLSVWLVSVSVARVVLFADNQVVLFDELEGQTRLSSGVVITMKLLVVDKTAGRRVSCLPSSIL